MQIAELQRLGAARPAHCRCICHVLLHVAPLPPLMFFPWTTLQIAELQRLEAARLAEAQRSLVRALSCFDEAIVLLDLTSPTEWRIKYANGAWSKLTGGCLAWSSLGFTLCATLAGRSHLVTNDSWAAPIGFFLVEPRSICAFVVGLAGTQSVLCGCVGLLE